MLESIQGKDVFLFVRKLKDAKTENGKLLPFQTSLDFEPSRDSDKTQTKSGVVSTMGAVETDLSVEFLNNADTIADAMYDSLFDGDVLECWVVQVSRKNANNEYFSFYMQATVSEDSSSNDPDDHSTREISFAVNGTPKRGWTALPESAMKQLEYAYRGIEALGDKETVGTPWKNTDNGVHEA